MHFPSRHEIGSLLNTQKNIIPVPSIAYLDPPEQNPTTPGRLPTIVVAAMSSKRRRQAAAARANEKNYQGPVTPKNSPPPAGSLAAQAVCLKNENPAEFTRLYDSLIAEHAPATTTEILTDEDMAICRWRLHRALTMETAILDNQMDHMRGDIAETYKSTDECTRAGLAFRKLTEISPSLTVLHRYQSGLTRQFDRCVKRLATLRAAAEKVKIPLEPSPINEHYDRQLSNHQPRPAQRPPSGGHRESAVTPFESPSEMGGLPLQTRRHDSGPSSGLTPSVPRVA